MISAKGLGLSSGLKERRAMIDPRAARAVGPSPVRAAAGVAFGAVLRKPVPTSPEELALMRRLSPELHLKHPFSTAVGSLSDVLRKEGREANRKRIQRLMRLMGIEAMVPTSPQHEQAPIRNM